jgi:hypothetical protein
MLLMKEPTMRRVVLLGDSIFDNAAYVAGGPDVIKQVQACLPAGWEGILRAVDGHVTTDVPQQLAGLPAHSYLIVSVGGNDALGYIDILNQRAQSTAEVLHMLADIHDKFHANYQQMLSAVLHQECPTALCTIYYPRFPDPVLQRLAVTALTIFNDCILHHAFAAGLPVLDLRLICNEEADYADPVEPSEHGGAKIAAAIISLLREYDFTRGRTEVFVK